MHIRPRQALSVFSAIGVLCFVTLAGCSGNDSGKSANGGSTVNTGASSGGGNSGGAASPAGMVSVLTYHNNNARTGQNTRETTLTHANVKASTFGKVGFDKVDGKVDAQPLYVPAVNVKGGKHNVLYVVTEHDSAYAFDADNGKLLWHVSLLGPHETPSDPRHCSQVKPVIGVTATPVIDPDAGPHGTIYIVAASKDSSGNYHQRLHAVDLVTGAERPGSPVEIRATYPSMGPLSSHGQLVFDPAQYNDRAGLLLLNGVVYIAWSSHCDIEPYTGWIMGYDENNLKQVGVLNLTPNGSEGAFWQAGDGPAADAKGYIYILEGNGTFDTDLNAKGFPSKGDYGNSFLKISTANGKLSVADYFTMSNTVAESKRDADLGSGGVIVLPDQTNSSGKVMHLAVGAGKDSIIYVVDRDNMGKFHPSGDHIYQELKNVLHGREFGTPAYWNHTVYYGAVGDAIRALPVTDAKLAAEPSSVTANTFPYPGAIPSVSSNDGSDGILWAVANSKPAVLYAYDATNLGHVLYRSNAVKPKGRDNFGPGNKFIAPMIANGRVYVGTQNGVAVFGLLKK